jgi:hypothetical protein
MSVKTTLAKKAVKTTAIGGVVGWLIGRSGNDEPFEPVAPAGPTSVVTTPTNSNSTEHASETGAVS